MYIFFKCTYSYFDRDSVVLQTNVPKMTTVRNPTTKSPEACSRMASTSHCLISFGSLAFVQLEIPRISQLSISAVFKYANWVQTLQILLPSLTCLQLKFLIWNSLYCQANCERCIPSFKQASSLTLGPIM